MNNARFLINFDIVLVFYTTFLGTVHLRFTIQNTLIYYTIES
jgi:hypothetical protein